MNILIRHVNPTHCAMLAWYFHLAGMAKEALQVLSTIRHAHGFPAPYKPTHSHHPIVLWAGQSAAHYTFTLTRVRSLLDEHTRRYSRSEPLEAAYLACLDVPLPAGEIESYCVCRVNRPPVHVPTLEEAVELYTAYLAGKGQLRTVETVEQENQKLLQLVTTRAFGRGAEAGDSVLGICASVRSERLGKGRSVPKWVDEAVNNYFIVNHFLCCEAPHALL